MALDDVKGLEGSPNRDRYKNLRKSYIDRRCWGTDLDFILVEKRPLPFIVAILDFKMPWDGVTFTEALVYDVFARDNKPVYLLTGPYDFLDTEPQQHRFKLELITALDYKPFPPDVTTKVILKNATWEELSIWEMALRKNRKRDILA